MISASEPLDRLAYDALDPLLRTRSFGRVLHPFAEIPSTQAAALASAAVESVEGTLFLAESQTQGRGRHGHRWDSPPGAGLYASLVLRPSATPSSATLLTLAYGLAIADAVTAITGLTPQVRWPNDLLLGGKKFCGLLLEMRADATRILYAVLGFGINVRPRSFPPELDSIATALDSHVQCPVSRLRLLAAVLEQLEFRNEQFYNRSSAQLIAEVESRTPALRGQPVVVDGERGASWHAVTEGLDREGFLLVRASGGLRRVISGDVRADGPSRSAMQPRRPPRLSRS